MDAEAPQAALPGLPLLLRLVGGPAAERSAAHPPPSREDLDNLLGRAASKVFHAVFSSNFKSEALLPSAHELRLLISVILCASGHGTRRWPRSPISALDADLA